MAINARSTQGYVSRTTAFAPAASAPAVSALEVRRIDTGDLVHALRLGLEDFRANRTDILFLCLVYPAVGLVLGRLASGYGLLAMLFPLASGFALIGPFAAVGLNDMSRRRAQGEKLGMMSGFAVFRSPAIGTIITLGLALAALLVVWLGVAQLVYANTIGTVPATMGGFMHEVMATRPGWALIILGCGAGLVFAMVALAVSVVSFPLLLDRNVGLEVAVRTSLRVVAANPVPMATWGLIVAGLLIAGSVPLFLGLILVMPVLGHATWHLYRAVVR